jgi:hypothetical protein
MNDFVFWFKHGFEHIANTNALDHLLYLVALCLGFTLKNWKKTLWLVTAFTLGHNLTLLLVASKWIHLPSNWIEFFIPLTIFATCVIKLYGEFTYRGKANHFDFSYLLALLFGLIHGTAFANGAISLEGEKGILLKIFGFNVGIEAAQFMVVLIILIINFIFTHWLRIKSKWLVLATALPIMVFSIQLAIKNFPN